MMIVSFPSVRQQQQQQQQKQHKRPLQIEYSHQAFSNTLFRVQQMYNIISQKLNKTRTCQLLGSKMKAIFRCGFWSRDDFEYLPVVSSLLNFTERPSVSVADDEINTSITMTVVGRIYMLTTRLNKGAPEPLTEWTGTCYRRAVFSDDWL